MQGNSFYLKLDSIDHSAMRVTSKESDLWHKRLGHFNLKTLEYMFKNKLAEDLGEIVSYSDPCPSCSLGKQSRKPFPKTALKRATRTLELLHSDICGPMSTKSLGNNLYFVLFIDDYTRMTWVYFLKQKSEVFSVFKRFKQMIEVQSGLKIKVLRTDNGGEYTSNEFKAFCDEFGIVHQLTIPYSPQQNGVAERKNRTVMEMARCLVCN